MKKIMWIAAMIPVVVTSVVLQFMPDVIPMHHDLEGNTDRLGSKTESLIFPISILFITLFWHVLINIFEKKSITAKTEKEQMEAKSSAKLLCVVGLSQAVMFGIMHYFILYSIKHVPTRICKEIGGTVFFCILIFKLYELSFIQSGKSL